MSLDGREVNLNGYEEMARLRSDNNAYSVVVVHNNSSHYLVGILSCERPGAMTVRQTFQYYSDDSGDTTSIAYVRALIAAASLAIEVD